MIVWPEALVRELAERRCLIFLGAGASAGCLAANGVTRPPDWREFLVRLLARVNDPNERQVAQGLIDERLYLDAAEVIKANVLQPDFSQFLRDQLLLPRFQPSQIHKAVLSIDPKVVVTTNYDLVYDNFCREGDAEDGYNICRYYDSHLVSDLRSPIRVVVKSHGCVSDPSKIILTRSSYFEQRRNHANFFRVLDGLFICSSILFLGYSLSDPDIQLVLENANIAAPESHPHYAVVSNAVHPALKRSWAKSYNISFLEYPDGDYDGLNGDLEILATDVMAFREQHVLR